MLTDLLFNGTFAGGVVEGGKGGVEWISFLFHISQVKQLQT